MRPFIPLMVMLALALGGIGIAASIDRFSERRRRRWKAPASPGDYMCGCGHNLALHDVVNSRCFATEEFGGSQCACRQYIGPEHPTMFLSFKDINGPP